MSAEFLLAIQQITKPEKPSVDHLSTREKKMVSDLRYKMKVRGGKPKHPKNKLWEYV